MSSCSAVFLQSAKYKVTNLNPSNAKLVSRPTTFKSKINVSASVQFNPIVYSFQPKLSTNPSDPNAGWLYQCEWKEKKQKSITKQYNFTVQREENINKHSIDNPPNLRANFSDVKNVSVTCTCGTSAENACCMLETEPLIGPIGIGEFNIETSSQQEIDRKIRNFNEALANEVSILDSNTVGIVNYKQGNRTFSTLGEAVDAYIKTKSYDFAVPNNPRVSPFCRPYDKDTMQYLPNPAIPGWGHFATLATKVEFEIKNKTEVEVLPRTKSEGPKFTVRTIVPNIEGTAVGRKTQSINLDPSCSANSTQTIGSRNLDIYVGI
jgi:hypothetical protein